MVLTFAPEYLQSLRRDTCYYVTIHEPEPMKSGGIELENESRRPVMAGGS